MKRLLFLFLLLATVFGFSNFKVLELDGKPDLTIVNVNSNCQMPELIIEVKNIGKGTSKETLGQISPATNFAQKCIKDKEFKIPSLRPGESVTLKILLASNKGCFCRFGNTVIAGGMKFKIVVDAPNWLFESNEGNNSVVFHYN